MNWANVKNLIFGKKVPFCVELSQKRGKTGKFDKAILSLDELSYGQNFKNFRFFFFSQKIGKIGEKCDWKTNKIGFFEAKQEKLFFFFQI